MNAAETIAAAIEKLEQIKAQPVVTAHFQALADTPEGAWFARAQDKLAMFHRTIDAQLAILRAVGKILDNFSENTLTKPEQAIVALARAILGEVSDAS